MTKNRRSEGFIVKPVRRACARAAGYSDRLPCAHGARRAQHLRCSCSLRSIFYVREANERTTDFDWIIGQGARSASEMQF